MLDTFEVLTTSGVVLWSRTLSPVNPSIINDFIADIFIEEKGAAAGAKGDQSAANNAPYKADQHTLKWTFSKELGIIVVVSAMSHGPSSYDACFEVQVLTARCALGCIPLASPFVMGRQICRQSEDYLH